MCPRPSICSNLPLLQSPGYNYGISLDFVFVGALSTSRCFDVMHPRWVHFLLTFNNVHVFSLLSHAECVDRTALKA